MNTTSKKGLLSDPGAIAPSVDKAWRDDFIVELRLLSVPGTSIGDALMTVEAHVAESGESAQDAFGDARAYAREIAPSAGAGRIRGITGWTVVGTVAGLVGMLAAVRALTGWLEGGPIVLTVGDGVVLLLLLVLVAAVLRWATPVLRFVVEHRRAVALLAPVALVGGFVGVLLLLRQTWTEMGVLPVAVTAVVLLALSVVAAWVDTPADGDEIVTPEQGPRPRAGARLSAALILPVMTVLLLVLTWGLHALG
jgi:hypothetical protein